MDILKIFKACSDPAYNEDMVKKYLITFTVPSSGLYYITTPNKYYIVTERLTP